MTRIRGVSALAGGLIWLGLASVAPAQTSGPPGCDGIPGAKDFDFWVGEWDVYDRAGRMGGTNSITKRSGGCLILEEWTSATGGNGTSMNYLDPRTGDWVQTWMGVNNFITYRGGLDDKGRMVLTGEITYFGPNGSRTADFRGTWTPNEDGTVTQHFEEYDAGEELWKDWFIGTYKPSDSEPQERGR